MNDNVAVPSQLKTVEDLRGPAGRLEAMLNTGGEYARYAAVVAHPHPLHGGTMHNKVVYHTAKAFSNLGLPVLRFNFRGTGLSEGTHDRGHGEQEDLRAALDWLSVRFALPLLVAGFSFGSYVALKTCCGDLRVRGLAALGLPVRAAGRDYQYDFLRSCTGVPKLFVSGDQDDFSPRGVLEAALEPVPEPKRVVWVEGADHFFAGTADSPSSKLAILGATLRTWVTDEFALEGDS